MSDSTPPTSDFERFVRDQIRSTMIDHEDAVDTLWHRDRAVAAITGHWDSLDYPPRVHARRMAAAAHVVTSIGLFEAGDVAQHAVIVTGDERKDVIRNIARLHLSETLSGDELETEIEAVVHAMMEVSGAGG